jgi:hypothetical protein
LAGGALVEINNKLELIGFLLEPGMEKYIDHLWKKLEIKEK